MVFDCNLDRFKRMVKGFLDSAPTADRDSLEQGRAALGRGYLSVEGTEQDRHQAAIELRKGNRAYSRRSRDLTVAEAGWRNELMNHVAEMPVIE